MKIFKVLFVLIVSALLIAYVTFLFVLPNVLNLNDYKPQVEQFLKDSSGLNLKLGNLKLKTTPALKVTILSTSADLSYPIGTQLLKTKNLKIDIPLVPLLGRTFKVSKIEINSPVMYLRINKVGKIDIQTYFEEFSKNNSKGQEPVLLPVKISENMPDIIISDYNFVIFDEQINKNVFVKGEEFKIDRFKLNDKIRIASKGCVRTDLNKYLTYDFVLQSFLPDFESMKITETQSPYINPFANMIKYNFHTNLKADLKITQDLDKNTEIKGFLNVDNTNLKIKNKELLNNYLHLIFDKQEIKINSDLYLDFDEKAEIRGNIRTGKNPFINLDVKAPQVDIANLKDIFSGVLEIFNINSNIDDFIAKGHLNLNFSLNTDMKKLKSFGIIKAENLNISNPKIGLNITGIKTFVDFNNNNIRINDTKASVNGSDINIFGTIDQNAVSDIKIISENLPISKLFSAFAPYELRKNYKIQSGTLKFNVDLKGKLSEIKPKIYVVIDKFALKDKINNYVVLSDLIKMQVNSDLKKIEGVLASELIKINLSNVQTTINAKKLNLKIDEKDIIITPLNITNGSSILKLHGKIENYQKTPKIEVLLNGKLVSNELRKFMPKEIKPYLGTNGSLPLIANVKSNGTNSRIQAQIFANGTNYFSPIKIHQLANSPSILNFDVSLGDNELNVNDFSLYKVQSPSVSANFKQNISTGIKFLNSKGKITHLSSKRPVINGFEIQTPHQVSFSIPTLNGSLISLKTDLNVVGNIAKPEVKGFINISNLKIPTYKIYSDLISVNLTKNAIFANGTNFKLGNSPFEFDLSASNNLFAKTFLINDMKLISTSVDLDSIMNVMSIIPQNSIAPGTDMPIRIMKGSAKFGHFKTGTLQASNIKTDFSMNKNVLSLYNLNANAYEGMLKGKMAYDLKYLKMKINLGGRNLDANSAISAFMGIKDQMQGNLNFDANLNMIGATQNQQMQTLRGNANFIIANGQMGSLGKFEHFLGAQNLISQSFIKTSIGRTIRAISPQNTARFEYLKGSLIFSNGWANLSPVLMTGDNMALYIDGRLNLLNNNGDIDILGRISPSVALNLGVVNDLSISSLTSNIPKFGVPAAKILNSYNVSTSKQYIEKIPSLTSNQSGETKEFRVKISGNVMNPTSVKLFQWLASQSEMNATSQQILNNQTQQQTPSKVIQQTKTQIQNKIQNKIPDFMNKLPDFIY